MKMAKMSLPLLFIALFGLPSAELFSGDFRPQLDPDLEETVIESGSVLKLRCQGKTSVRWEMPKTLTQDDRRITYNYERDSNYPYITHLEVPATKHYFTGYYRCADNKTVNLEDESKVASIYVYVEDKDNLLAVDVVDEPITILGTLSHSIIIPCRPTHPDVNVTLEKDNELIEVNGLKVIYDPRVGFTHNSPRDLGFGLVEVTCIAVRGSHEQKIDATGVISSKEDLPVPVIQGPHHAVIGEQLELNCSVVRHDSVYININLKWDVPDRSGLQNQRIVVGNLSSSKQSGSTDQVTRSLTVKRVLREDEGMYVCSVEDFSEDNTKEVEKYIRVLEANQSYVNLTVQGDVSNINTTVGAQNVQWVVYYTGHPQPQLIWYDSSGQEISSNDKFDLHFDASTTRLRIKEPRIEDSGEYTLMARTINITDSRKFLLNVQGPPEVNMTVEPFYMYGDQVELHCFALGNPIPVVIWALHPCQFNEASCEPNELDEIYGSQLDTVHRNLVDSKLTVQATTSGRLRCSACNTQCVHKDQNFYVTDVPGGFDLKAPNLTIDGDFVTLTCRASVYTYSNQLSWYFRGVPLDTYSDQYVVVSNTTKFSHQTFLAIRNITKRDSGLYKCEACSLDPDAGCKQLEKLIDVTEVKSPLMSNKTNLEGQTLELVYGQNHKLKCFATGMPNPKITWYKENMAILRRENIEIGDHSLEFKYFTSEDEGEYKCEASNRGGRVSRTITIRLLAGKTVNVALVVGLLTLAVLLVAVICYLFLRIRREQKLRIQLTQAGLIHFEEGDVENLNADLGIGDQAELLPYDRKFEFPRNRLKLGKTLGSGAFGVVVKAEAYDIVEGEPVTPVAVKMVKRNADNNIIKALASELKIMVHLGRHINVVNLLGACTKGLNKMELLVIVEYCRYGNLHNYLLRHRKLFIDQIDPTTGLIDSNRGIEVLSQSHSNNGRPSSHLSDSMSGDPPLESRADYRSQSDSSENFGTGATEATLVSMSPTGEDSFILSNNSDWRTNYRGDFKGDISPISTRDLLCYSFQVARGMEYLASRKVLHGDLAARNILLADNNVVKICDFGLAKTMYKDDNYQSKGKGLLPIKWMAIESIRDRIFSTQSDVWSFGIVLWEFFTLSRTPYPGMAADEQFYQKLESGYRMEKPVYATEELFQLMLACWRARPTLRPSFTDLEEKLGTMLEESVRQHYVDLNEPYVQMNTQWLKDGHNDYLGMLNSPNYSNVMSPHEEEEPLRYQNVPTAVDGDATIPGYLSMKSPSPNDPHSIFSPTRPGGVNGGNIFKFHTPPQLRRSLQDAEVNDHVELKPMLSNTSRQSDSASGHESDTDLNAQYTAVPSSRPVIRNSDKSLKTRNVSPSQIPSFSNPSYQMAPNVLTSSDNYINYPQQRTVHNNPQDAIANMRTPTFSTFGRKPSSDVKLPSYYANLPSQRHGLALNEIDAEEPPYIN